MYFSGHLAIDPSQESNLRRVKPSDLAGKIAYFLSGGATGKLEEMESFITVNILQQINMALRAISIDNFVHLLRNNKEVYRDNSGDQHDLKKIMDEFRFETAAENPENFQTILLVCEHEDEHFRYLLDIHIARIHSPQAYPIHVRVDGIPKASENMDAINIQGICASQSAYDAFLAEKDPCFRDFLNLLKRTFGKYIVSDDIRCGQRRCIVSPHKTATRLSTRKAIADSALFRSYFGFDSFPQYARRWATAMETGKINCRESTIVDLWGRPVMVTDVNGFNCGELPLTDMGKHFQSLTTGVFCRFSGHHYHFKPDDRPLMRYEKFALPHQDLGWSIVKSDTGTL